MPAIVTLVLSAEKFSLSVLVAVRSWATLSFNAFTSSATCSLAIGATAGGAELIIGPNLATPSDPPTAPKLAAIATQAARSAKRVERDGEVACAATGSGCFNATTGASCGAGGNGGA